MRDYTPEFKAEVVQYYLDGHGSLETSKEFGLSPRGVILWVKAAGHEIRPRGKTVRSMHIHRNAAVKVVSKPAPKPEPAPVQESELARELKPLLPKDRSRLQIIDATTVIVWNSVEQRRALQKCVL